MVLDLVLIGLGYEERWNSDHLVVDGDVSMSDFTSGIVNGHGDFGLCNQSLESSSHELIDGQSKNMIKLVFGSLVHESELKHSVQKSITLEYSSWIFWAKGQKISCGLSNSGNSQLDSPNFTLTLETVFTAYLDFTLDSFLLEWSFWGFKSLGTYSMLVYMLLCCLLFL